MDWGRVYTAKNILQIFEYSLGEFASETLFTRTAKGFVDPYREGPIFADESDAAQSIAEHRDRSAKALKSCEVLILTPGQNEAWVNRKDGLAWAHQPSRETLAEFGEDAFSVERYTLEQNVEYLNRALQSLRENNPSAKVIFTVSPVPSHATYFDENVACRSFENKAIILLAVKQVVRENPGETFYFPSFEMAMFSHNPNFLKDNRHVRMRVVDKIMSRFDSAFVVGR